MAVRKTPRRAKTGGRPPAPARARAGRPTTPRRGLPWGSRNDQTRVGVRELRQNLSVYLARVKTGEALTVTEHGRVVAVLAPAAQAMTPLERLIAEGRATPATRAWQDLPPPREPAAGAPAADGRPPDPRRGRLP